MLDTKSKIVWINPANMITPPILDKNLAILFV